MIRRFIDWNQRLSRGLDRLLPADYVIDGNSDFKNNFALKWLTTTARVVDIGGGKNPFITAEIKNALALHVTGVDISAQELEKAPVGAYDNIICADICGTAGTGDADLCFCQAVLEHVQDVAAAFEAIASFLKPGGIALIFVPSRNAVIEEAKYYYVSSYFSFLFPLYALWRAWIVLFKRLAGEQAAETFSMAMKKNPLTSLL